MQKFETSNEKLIHYENPKRRKHWVDPGQSTTSTQQRNVFGKKILIHIWWDAWDVSVLRAAYTGRNCYWKILQSLIKSLGRKNPRKTTL